MFLIVDLLIQTDIHDDIHENNDSIVIRFWGVDIEEIYNNNGLRIKTWKEVNTVETP